MTHVHVVPTADRLELHRLADCPCRPRQRQIHRSDGMVELLHLHRALDFDGDSSPIYDDHGRMGRNVES